MDLLERDAPLALINDTFDRVRTGQGALALVSGEAGIGKTSFVTDFVELQRSFARIYRALATRSSRRARSA